MPNQVSKSLVVDFTQGSGGAGNRGSNGGELALFYDTRPVTEGGLNARRRPLFSDVAKFLLYPFKADNITASSSSGTVSVDNAPQTQVLTETVTFDQSNTTRVKRPVSKILSVQWVGNDGGNVTAEGSTISIAEAGSLVATVTYETAYLVVSLTPPSLNVDTTDEYTINITVTADEVL
ncbi:hypothetical protein NVP1215B_083 [Vibrio phage 1.215.B._10N.222.54.F7]|nr:hypothetical protein NVP1215A_083 [Vibrio phage 1.215.A._10N.222.54.F7]AUR96106.1 hypothetical protein NVP1215B_083 [Vibrio phage 1.215.B._10N.222.54.F7]